MEDELGQKNSKLHKFNNFLSFVVVALGLYIALIPLLPTIQLWWKQRGGVHVPYSGALANASVNASKDNNPIPKDNRIVIPSISVNEPVFEGSSISVIDNGGTWRRPNSSNNPSSSNMVIVGHRFTYTNPYGSFYHLDKLKIGDHLAVYWQGKEYVYEVAETKVVEPTAQEVEAKTNNAQLTLYTCTPIWSAKQRLVVIAKPVDLNSSANKVGGLNR